MNPRLVLALVTGAASLTFAFALGCNTPPSTSVITERAPESAGSAVAPRAGPASAEPSSESGRLEIVEATEDSDAVSLIRSKRLEAKARSRVLIVYVGAKWCEPCRRFKAEVASGRLDERLGKTTLLAFDADRDTDRLGAAGYSFKFIPFVALPRADGQPADATQATGKGGEAWRELLDKLDAWQRGD